jgi:hypothetical protein
VHACNMLRAVARIFSLDQLKRHACPAQLGT